MADGVANAQVLPLFAVQQDGEQFVGHHFAHNLADVGQQLVEIQRRAGGGGDFEQEVEQLAALAKTDGGFTGRSLHQSLIESSPRLLDAVHAADASTISTPALVPMRVAPAAVMRRKSSSVRMPPA